MEFRDFAFVSDNVKGVLDTLEQLSLDDKLDCWDSSMDAMNRAKATLLEAGITEALAIKTVFQFLTALSEFVEVDNVTDTAQNLQILCLVIGE